MDLGCGEGRLLQRLLDEPRYRDINRADVSARSLEIARRRLGLRKMKTAGTASACCTVVLTTPNRELPRQVREHAAERPAGPGPPVRVDPRRVRDLGPEGTSGHKYVNVF